LTDEEYQARLTAIERLADRLPGAEITEKNAKGYVWSLSDLPLTTLEAAIDRTIDTYKFGSIFPTVAEIRENAEAIASKSDGNEHPANCVCHGSGMIVPERVDGYSSGARRCIDIDIVIVEAEDEIDKW